MKTPFSQTSKMFSSGFSSVDFGKNLNFEKQKFENPKTKIEIDIWVKTLSVYRSYKNPDKFYCYLNGDVMEKSSAQFFRGFATFEEIQVCFKNSKFNIF